MFKVLVADSIESEGISTLAAAGLKLDVRSGLDEGPLVEAIADADAVLVRSRTRVSARAIAAGTRLRLITRAGIGVDNVDVPAASRAGVIVTNVPDATTTTTAELAIALLCSLARHIPAADRNIRSLKYDRNKFLGTEICGKTLGIIGFGRIGRIVAGLGLGLKMRVVAFDPFLPVGASTIPGVALVELDTLLASADFISLHAPLTETTKNILNETTLARCKQGVRIINAARGGIIDENALADALKRGHVGGAALDVTEVEPLPAGSPLRNLDQVILTPHLGASTAEAQRRVAIEAARQIIEFAGTGHARSAVNVTILPAELRDELGPYVALAQRMGFFAGTLLAGHPGAGAVKRLQFVFRGPSFERDDGDRAAAAVRASALAGLLQPAYDAFVSPVSAPVLSRERGIEVSESREAHDPDYHHRIDFRITTDRGDSLVIGGSCLGRRPRIVEIDGVRLDAGLEGELLVTRHEDRPGMVGRIGTCLGNRGVNLDRVDLGPLPGTGLAVGIFGTGGALADESVADVRSLDGVQRATRVRLGDVES